MNTLSQISIDFPDIRYCRSLAMDTYGYIDIPDDVIIDLGAYRITAAELSYKLQLLDRLIAEILPEELI